MCEIILPGFFGYVIENTLHKSDNKYNNNNNNIGSNSAMHILSSCMT
jgi:hypothetical protein